MMWGSKSASLRCKIVNDLQLCAPLRLCVMNFRLGIRSVLRHWLKKCDRFAES